MPALFEYRHTVLATEIDELGHVNNLAHLRWMQSAAIAHSAAQGWPGPAYRELGGGFVVRRHEIEYRQPAFVDEEIVVRTWVADMRKMTSLRRYEIVRPADGVLLAVAATNWAFIDFATGRLNRIPLEVSSAFELVPDRAGH